MTTPTPDELLAAAQIIRNDCPTDPPCRDCKRCRAADYLESCAALMQQREREVTDEQLLTGINAWFSGNTPIEELKTAPEIAGWKARMRKVVKALAAWPAADKDDAGDWKALAKKLYEGYDVTETSYGLRVDANMKAHSAIELYRAIAAEQKESGK
jgi:hypothetical protein